MTDRSADKAVILAAGLGTRMRTADPAAGLTSEQAAAADRGIKAMLPIGRPFLDYVLHNLAEAGFRQICLVVGPDHDVIQRYYRDLRPRRLSISFAVQPSPRGTADALLPAEAFVADEPFLAINSDNFYPVAACAALRAVAGPGLAAFDRETLLAESNLSPERIHNNAALQISSDGYLRRIIEKPDEATLAALGSPIYLSMNCWMMTPTIFAACRSITPSVRGELEITDAVQYAIDRLEMRFRVLPFAAPVLDLSSRRDIPAVAARLAQMEVDL